MDVTDVLRDRMREPVGFQRMVTLSIVVQIALAAAIMLTPGGLLGRRADDNREVMTISLAGGGEGPRNGGFTTIGGRPVQEVRPPEEAPKREAVRPPAAKPEMTTPTKAAAKPSKAVDVKQAPDQARGRTPIKGEKIEFGSAIAQTGARGQGFGLSTGGGPGSGSQLEVSDFCCPDYIVTMLERIRAAWNQNQNATGVCTVRFVIQRDGKITDATVFQSSGSDVLNLASLRAVLTTRALPPLPAQFPNATLPVRLAFEYR